MSTTKPNRHPDYWNGEPFNAAKIKRQLSAAPQVARPKRIHTEARQLVRELERAGRFTPEYISLVRDLALPAERREGRNVTLLRVYNAARAVSHRDIQRACKRLGITRNFVRVAESYPASR